MGYLYGIFDRKPSQAQALGFFPCATGCEGSRSGPENCRCICRGINHGRLRHGRPMQPVPIPKEGQYPIFEELPDPQMPMLPESPMQLPDLSLAREEKKLELEERRLVLEERRQETNRLKAPSLKRRVGRSFVSSVTGHVNEKALNDSVYRGMRLQFNEENVQAAIGQAYTGFYSRVGHDANRPELYELYENGDLDRAFAYFGKGWAIGRPKRRK